MIAHLVWDWNGTLVDDAEACVASLNDLLRNHGFRQVTVEEYRRDFGFPVQDYYVRLGFDFDRHDWKRVADEYFEYYGIRERGAGLRKGALEMLAFLRKRNIPMSVLSASEMAVLERMVTERGIKGYFQGLYGLSNSFADSKVDIGRKLLAGLGCDPSSVLLVGDTIHDHEVASAMGCCCVLMCGGHQTRDRLESTGREVLSDIAELEEYLR